MPIFDYLCNDCGKVSELLVADSQQTPECEGCGSKNLKKMLSAHSSFSGFSKNRAPGPGDNACCGSSPGTAAGCAGPGSCCGKNFS